MTPFTEEQALVIMGFTGFSTCNFAKFHEDVEKRLGESVFSHQLKCVRDFKMKICNETEEMKDNYQHPKLILGNLYKHNNSQDIFICAESDKLGEFRLVCIQDGQLWSVRNGFSFYDEVWTDVTDQYCLKKVK